MIDTSIVGTEHYLHPFTIGRVLQQGPYVHVLDELTLDVVLRELDTIKDLVEYFQRKETLLTHPTRAIMATGEEQLVAMYLTRVDDTGQHNFTGIPDDAHGVYIEEGHWEDFIRSQQYVAKKRADDDSYAWDRLIEHLADRGEVGVGDDRRRDVALMEPALRVLASEPRLARRQFASQLLEALRKDVRPGQRFLRLGFSKQASDTAYVFLVLPRPSFAATYGDYRESRRALLLACCKVARLRATSALRIVGIATEPRGTKGASEDLLLLEVSGKYWGQEQEEEARTLQREVGILLDETVTLYDRHDDEYPEDARPMPGLSPAQRLIERARIRQLQSLKRRPRKIS